MKCSVDSVVLRPKRRPTGYSGVILADSDYAITSGLMTIRPEARHYLPRAL